MDAKHAKTLSGVVALLLVSSLFAIPFAGAQSDDDGSVTFDATAGTKDGHYVVEDDGDKGSITFNTSWEVTFTNVSSGQHALFFTDGNSATPKPTDSDVDYHSNYSAYSDGTGDGTGYSVTFPASSIGSEEPVGRFDRVGDWHLARWNGSAWNHEGKILVNATENLRVTLDPSGVTFTGDRLTLKATVTDLDTGSAVSGAIVDLGDLTSTDYTTNSNGVVEWTGRPSAGEYTITATKQGGDSSGQPEYKGEATFAVNAASLDVEAESTSVFHSFSGDVTYNFEDADDSKYLFVLDTPGDCTRWYNGTASDSWGSADANKGDDCGDLTAPTMNITRESWGDVEDQVNVTVKSSDWDRGTYSLSIGVSTDSDDDAEYEGTVQWSTRAPASLNPEADPEKFSDVPSLTSGNDLDGKSLTVKLTLDEEGLYPSWDSQKQFEENVTITGDFLSIVEDGSRVAPQIGTYNASGNGEFTIDRLYLSEGGGSVNVAVQIGDETAELAIPVETGASITADKDELVVDQTDTITFTLNGPSGGAASFGKVDLYRVDNGDGTLVSLDESIRGDGSAGRGADGEYEFALELDTLDTYVAVGEVGNEYFAYTTFRVVPAHDISAELLENSTFLATDTKTVRVNATLPGDELLSQTPDIYVLNSGQLETFQANPGELPAALDQSEISLWKDSDGVVLGYEFDFTSTDPDTYTVYVVSRPDGKHDNSESLVSFDVEHASVSFDPTGVASNANLQKETNITFTVVDHNGDPVDGKLQVNSDSLDYIAYMNDTDGNTISSPYVIDVEDGVANALITGDAIGTVEWEFQVDGSSAWSDALGTFEVLGPNIAFSPEELDLNSNRLTVEVRSLEGEALSDLNVTVCGFPLGANETPDSDRSNVDGCAGTETTDEDGVATLGFNPSRTGDLYLYVEGERTDSTVRVGVPKPGLRVSAPNDVTAGEEMGIFVGQIGSDGVGVAGATVTITHGDHVDFEGETGANGLLKWTPDHAGDRTVEVSKAGYNGDSTTFAVSEPVQEPEPKEPQFEVTGLALNPSSVELGQTAQAVVTVENTGEGAGEETLVLRVDGVHVDSMTVSLGAGESDQFGLSFTPNRAADFSVTATLGDAEFGPETLSVDTAETPDPANTETPNQPVPGFGVAAFALAALGVALVIGRRRL